MIVNANSISIPMTAESVHCVVTSPPYWGLRDYGLAPTEWPTVTYTPLAGLALVTVDAWRGCLGLEPTPEMFVGHIVAVFREVWRVLRDDGTLWLNFGDTYAGGGRGGNGDSITGRAKNASQCSHFTGGLKVKDLCGIPWRVAFALQADGWYLRNDIIWHKPNPMPESVTDRCTKSHEYLFLLSKNQRYFYDNQAVKEQAVEGTDLGILRGRHAGSSTSQTVAWHAQSIKDRQDAGIDSRTANPSGTRNRRTVWTIPTRGYSGAHDNEEHPRGLPGRC